MGQEYVKANTRMPLWWAEMVMRAASKAFSSSAHVDIYARHPFFMNPVLAACQVIGCFGVGGGGGGCREQSGLSASV
jgi:hypothetical protein